MYPPDLGQGAKVYLFHNAGAAMNHRACDICGHALLMGSTLVPKSSASAPRLLQLMVMAAKVFVSRASSAADLDLLPAAARSLALVMLVQFSTREGLPSWWNIYLSVCLSVYLSLSLYIYIPFVDDFPSETPICSGFPIAMFDYRMVVCMLQGDTVLQGRINVD